MTSCDVQDEKRTEVFPVLEIPASAETDAQNPVFRHPFRDALTTEGIIFHDVRTAPNGEAYAMGELGDVVSPDYPKGYSGIFTISRSPIPPAELEELRRQGRRGYDRHENSSPVLPDTLLSKMADLADTDSMTVMISLQKPEHYKPITVQLEEAIALGEVVEEKELEEARGQILAIQRSEVQTAILPVVQYIESIGGKVRAVCKNTFCLEADLNARQIQMLAEHSGVSRIDPLGKIKENLISASVISYGTQMDTKTSGSSFVQFIDDGFIGNRAYSSRLKAGVVEHQQLLEEHVGFKDGSGNSRISLMRNCGYYYEFPYGMVQKCVSVSGFNPPDLNHATSVSGIIMGDLTLGQDPWVVSSLDRRNRSGFAGGGGLMFWRAEDDNFLDNALDNIAGLSSPPHVVNMSTEYAGVDTSCTGEDTLSRIANNLYEVGVPLIYAIGNDGHISTSNCRIDSPGSSIGTFVVGNHTLESNYYETHVRYGSINPTSSRGGTTSEGKGRTITDLTAAGCHLYLFDKDGSYEGGGCGTSFSAPTVAAGALQMMDFYKFTYSSAMEYNPGKLYAQLLLMGDMTESSSTGQPDSSYDNLWGAGRFKMRRFDTYGLDAYEATTPKYGFGSFETCIDDGESYEFYLNNGLAIPNDVDIIKVVAFWYDSRHELGTAIDNIDISLLNYQNGNWVFTSSLNGGAYPEASSTSTTDEKERLHFRYNGNGVLSTYYKVRILGTDVTSGNTGCGTNSIRVHIAYLWEDSDRDDVNGPDSEIDLE